VGSEAVSAAGPVLKLAGLEAVFAALKLAGPALKVAGPALKVAGTALKLAGTLEAVTLLGTSQVGLPAAGPSDFELAAGISDF